MALTPNIDIVVPCYNVERTIELCIKSLINQTYPRDKYHCYFINDASTDTTAKILEKYKEYEQVTLLTHIVNRGRAAARNTGIKKGTSELIYFLDGDMEVKSDWVRSFFPYFEPLDIIAVMGDNIPPKGNVLNSIEQYYFSQLRGARQLLDGERIPVKWALFGNTAIKREVLNEVGVFDESFSSYGGEDTDLSIRVFKKYSRGFRFSKKSNAIHHHNRTLTTFCKSMKQYGQNNLPVLLSRYPAQEKDLAGDWIKSFKGYLIFNPIVRSVVKTLRSIYKIPKLTRYMVVDAVIQGARNAEEKKHNHF